MGGLPTNRTVNGFAVDPGNPQVMYTATRDGLFKSVNAGGRWASVGKGLKNLAAVAVHPRRPAEVYVATMNGVIYRSRDGGTTWQRP
ncbi:MAG: WD40/YVTN/BNR-like repeat-containing protein [Candidatus Rokuibacteriota bacterium]